MWTFWNTANSASHLNILYHNLIFCITTIDPLTFWFTDYPLTQHSADYQLKFYILHLRLPLIQYSASKIKPLLTIKFFIGDDPSDSPPKSNICISGPGVVQCGVCDNSEVCGGVVCSASVPTYTRTVSWVRNTNRRGYVLILGMLMEILTEHFALYKTNVLINN